MSGLYFNSGIDNGFDKDIKKMQQQVEALSKTVTKEGNSIDSTFKTIGKTVGAAITVAALAEAGKAIINFSTGLETALGEIATISKEVNDNTEQYKNTLIALSTTEDLAASSAQQLAEAYYEIVSAGYDGADGLKVLEAAARAGTAGFVDAMVAGDGITTVLNAWGKSADEAGSVSDIFFKTVERGKTTFPELGANIAKVAPIAASMGISFEETSGAIASLTKQGTKTPEALTQLKAAMIGMNKVLGDGWAESMTFQEGLLAVEKQAGGSQNKLLELLGSSEAVLATLALTGKNANGAAMDLDAMNNALGATASATEKVVGTTDHQIKLLTNNILAAFEPLGDLGKGAISEIAAVLNEAFKSGDIERFGKAILWLVGAFTTYKVATMAQIQLQKIQKILMAEAILQKKLAAMEGIKLSNAEAIAAAKTNMMSMATKKAALSMRNMTAAFASNPIGLIITGLTLALPLLYKFIDSQKESTKIQKISEDSIGAYNASLVVEKDNLNNLFDQLKKTNPESEERRRLIEELKKINPEYTSLIDLETASEGELEIARKAANDELERKIALQAKETATSDINARLVEQIESIRKLEKEQSEVAKKFEGRSQEDINSTIQAYEDKINKVKETVEALKKEREEINAYYDAIIKGANKTSTSTGPTQAEIDAEAAKKAAFEKKMADEKAAEEAEKQREKDLKALEIENQKRINEIVQQYGTEDKLQVDANDKLLENQLWYYQEKRKLAKDELERAQTDAAIISTRIQINPELPELKRDKVDQYADAWKKLQQRYKENVAELKNYEEENTINNKTWKDSLELINGINQLVNDLITSFGDLDEGTKNVLTGVVQATGGLINMAQSVKAVSAAVTTLEKASAILAVIGAALQVFTAIVNMSKKAREIREEALVNELSQLHKVNLALIQQNALYEEGNTFFSDDKWGTALAGLSAYNFALGKQSEILDDINGSTTDRINAANATEYSFSGINKENANLIKIFNTADKAATELEQALGKVVIKTKDVGKVRNFFGKEDEYASILKLYPEVIDAAGDLDTVVLQSIVDTQKLSAEDKERLQNLIDMTNAATDAYSQFGDYISGIFGGIGDDIAQAFQTMYEGGDDAMKALEMSFSEMIESFTRDAIEFAFLQPYLDSLNAKTKALGEQYAKGEITAAELQQGVTDALSEFYNNIAAAEPLVLEAYKAADEAAAAAGFDSAFNAEPEPVTEPTINEPVSRAGQVSAAITEQTGSELVGRISALMLSSERIANYSADALDYAMQNLAYMKQIKLNTDYLPEIAANTRKTYEKLS